MAGSDDVEVEMDFAGGRAQAEYMTRVWGIAPERCLVVPVDVGKRSAGVAGR